MIQHKNQHQTFDTPAALSRTSLSKSLDHGSFDENKFYAQLFNGAGDPILILRPDLQIEYANSAADKFFNFSSAHSKGRYFKDCVTAHSLHKINSAVKQARHKFSQFRLDLEAIDGHRQRVTVELTIFPIVEQKKIKAFHVTLRDVSQERQIEALVRESQKMEAIQYLVSGTTKELQHPLLVLLKRIESIVNKYRGRSFEYVSFKEFAGIVDFFEVMRKQIQYCYDTTTKLTNLNKKRLKFESNYCQANAVIREIVRLKEQNLKNFNIKLKLRLFDKLPAVNLGELEFNQIIGHIIDNAVYAMPAGGQLTVTTLHLPESKQIRIEVIDNGVGISAEDLPHIFEPFFTTKQRGVGNSAGLGLSIVYSLVKEGHGQIHFKSSLRKGTTVQIILPAVQAAQKLHHSSK